MCHERHEKDKLDDYSNQIYGTKHVNYLEQCEGTKGNFKSRQSNKETQYNCHKKKKKSNNISRCY